jgi:hypothetical protein
VVAVAVAGVAINGQEDSGPTVPDDLSATGTTELPRLVPDHLPAGLELSQIGQHGSQTWLDNSVFYGHRQPGEAPVVDLTISWVSANEGSSTDVPDYPPATVRGHDGRSCAGAECAGIFGAGAQAGLAWTEAPGKWFYVSSPSLSVEQLTVIADGLVIGDHDAPSGWDPSTVIGVNEVNLGTLPADLPVPLDEVGRRNYKPEPGTSPPIVVGTDGSVPPQPADFIDLWYRQADDPTAALHVSVMPGDDLDIVGGLTGRTAEPIADVRGHPAQSVTLPVGTEGWDVERRRIVWQEAPDVVVMVETFGTPYDVDVLRDVAESLRPATDAEWQALENQLPDG